jgi:hypothetical protein
MDLQFSASSRHIQYRQFSVSVASYTRAFEIQFFRQKGLILLTNIHIHRDTHTHTHTHTHRRKQEEKFTVVTETEQDYSEKITTAE